MSARKPGSPGGHTGVRNIGGYPIESSRRAGKVRPVIGPRQYRKKFRANPSRALRRDWQLHMLGVDPDGDQPGR